MSKTIEEGEEVPLVAAKQSRGPRFGVVALLAACLVGVCVGYAGAVVRGGRGSTAPAASELNSFQKNKANAAFCTQCMNQGDMQPGVCCNACLM
mmetsp:Transcript_26989/g.80916  ORF Transcript_26989/g.80916 Transcript_26989/m.80916 type:complete len:94 (-) Transcript_26989:71-352(-)|eukprot:CAMPEP_0119261614 /NCGR_PEP_ID=MMETSP1329-20130426/1622_1 /TAXON_ID=114041 /ORGANISM="Genus nov. species nov., Strain RCC1024" /LENGTH=93 /DNA_ID=CAMNT_0007261185 /DNA_START=163 /DNA_END=444 /DNA_ORIENTATION=-